MYFSDHLDSLRFLVLIFRPEFSQDRLPLPTYIVGNTLYICER
jgi:hypothetical protein